MPSAASRRPSAGERRDEQHEEAARRVGVIDERLDRAELGDGLFGVEVAQSVQHAGGERRWRQGGADDEFRASWTGLRGGIVDLPAGFAVDILFVHVVDDADDVQIVFGSSRLT